MDVFRHVSVGYAMLGAILCIEACGILVLEIGIGFFCLLHLVND